MSCEIQFFRVYEVSDNNYWVEMILYNNSDYTFDGSLKYFDDIEITNLPHDEIIDVRPADTINLEFAFTGIIGNTITMGFDITNNENIAFCTKKVEI